MNHYILDTNFFIVAMGKIYRPEIFPGFWDWIYEEVTSGTLVIIDKVYDELNHFDSKISQWLKEKKLKEYIVKTDGLMPQLQQINKTVENIKFGKEKYTEQAKNTFFQIADSRIIAYALEQKGIVVSDEKPSNSIGNVKIPNICDELNVEHIYNHQLFNHFNPVFYWDKDSYKK